MKKSTQHKKGLTREDIDRYQSTGDEQIKHSIESKSLTSDFETDALDGWAESGATVSTLKNLDKQFSTSSNIGFYLLGASVVIIGVGTYFYSSLPSETLPLNQQEIQLTAEKTDIVLPELIDTLDELPKEKSIQPSKVKEDFKGIHTQKKEVKENPSIQPKEEIAIETLPFIEPPLVQPTPVITKIEGKEIYLSDLKIVDYREYRDAPTVTAKVMTLSGLPANMESDESVTEEVVWKDSDIPYIDYIRKTQQTFSRENYKKALSRYLVILNTYPDDVNALFYSGLCYFNLEQYDLAIEQLKKSLTSRFNNFKDESEWYLALSYQSSGRDNEAKTVLKAISTNKSFYSSQAEKLLRSY